MARLASTGASRPGLRGSGSALAATEIGAGESQTAASRRQTEPAAAARAASLTLGRRLHLSTALICTQLPHPAKKETGGEDAYLLGPHMVGVADGVGSWWEGGINPADYARALMHACRGSCVRMREEIELHPQQVRSK